MYLSQVKGWWRGGFSEMIALFPAFDRAVPQHPADRIDKGKRASFELRGGAEPRQPANVGLVLGDVERRHILHNRIWAGRTEPGVFVFLHPAGLGRPVPPKTPTRGPRKSGDAQRPQL